MSGPSRKFILAACCGLFFLLGLISALIGPLLAELARNNGVSLEAIGSLFTAIFLGALLSQLAAGPLGDRAGHTWIVLGGTLVMAAGALVFSLSTLLVVTLVFGFLYGLGHGALDLGTNLLVAEEFKSSSVSALNLLNLFFGLGAFAGPALVSLSLGAWSSGLPVMWGTCLALLAFTPVTLRFRAAVRRPSHEGAQELAAAPKASDGMGVYRSPVVWSFAVLIMVYVGCEVGMGGWTTTYMQRAAGVPIETASLVTSGFWLALTAGRMVTALFGLRLNPDHLLTGSLAGAAAGGLLLALSPSTTLTIAAVLLIGFCFGPVFPTVIAAITTRFPEQPGRAASVVAAMGAVGGAILPALQGVLLERTGVMGSAWFTAGGALVMLVLMLCSSRQKKTSP